jgi:uncharacterized membrane protein
MDWNLLLRFLHISSAIVLVGGLIARQFVVSMARNSDEVHDFAAFNRAVLSIERRMVLPGSLAVFVFGLILALRVKEPILGFIQGRSENWLLVALLLLISLSVVGPTIIQPRARKVEEILAVAQDAGQITPELREAAADPLVRAANWYELAAVVIVVFLMVFKPF